MGTAKPEPTKPKTKTGKPALLVAVLISMGILAIALFPRISLEEEFGSPKLHPKEEERLQRRLKEIDDSEQYALLAETDGWYPCLHKGRSIYYLKAGEVWKYGVTSKGKLGRYRTDFLIKNNVSYFVQFNGTYSECLKQEQIKLFNYPFLPENLARPKTEQLPRPPFNSIMR